MIKRKQWVKAVRHGRNQAEYNEGAAPPLRRVGELERPSARREDETIKKIKIMKKTHCPSELEEYSDLNIENKEQSYNSSSCFLNTTCSIVCPRCCRHGNKDTNKHTYNEYSSSAHGSASTSTPSIHSCSLPNGRGNKRRKRIKYMRAVTNLTCRRPHRVVNKVGRRERKGFSKRTQCGINVVTAVVIKLSIAILLGTLL